jgi:hypothetical protein
MNPARLADVAPISERSALMLLALLLFADFAFIVLHYLDAPHRFLKNALLSINNDRSYPELYQYLKWLWITLILTYLAVVRRSLGYIAWALVFAYFLCDDALSIHERAGQHLSERFEFNPFMGLRSRDLGELTVSVTVAAVLLLPLAGAYWRGSRAFRNTSQDVLLFIAALVFVGVVADMLHVALHPGPTLASLLVVVEDGGEMLIASLILAYVFQLSIRGADSTSYLCDSIRGVLQRRREHGSRAE